jgi:hypothetical protein
MSNLEEARRVKRNYHRRIKRLTDKVRKGSNEAAIKIIATLTEMETKIQVLGFRLTENGKLVENVVQQKEESEADRLIARSRAGDPYAMVEIVRFLAEVDGS